MDIQLRTVDNPDDMLDVVRLPADVWGTLDSKIEMYYLLMAMQHAGGIVLGAFDGDQPMGVLLGFPGIRNGQLLHWSHMTGVLPGYQGRGVGTKLKLRQRELVLEQGYDCIAWTYDPLQKGNAAFNLGRLGCVCNLYHEDFYGDMPDGINAGLPSDRFEVRWWLESNTVKARIAQEPSAQPESQEVASIHRVLAMQPDGSPGDIHWPDNNGTTTLVEIPANINQLKAESPEKALAWRLQTRQVFNTLFQVGYMAVDFLATATDTAHFFYVLKKQ